MKLFNQALEFWIIVGLAIVFKITTSERLTKLGVAATATGSVLAAVAMTPLVLEWFDIQSESAAYAIAAFMALTGEHTLRSIILKAQNGESPGSIINWFRNAKDDAPPGGKK